MLIGIGPGNVNLLTSEAKTAVQLAEVIIGSKRAVKIADEVDGCVYMEKYEEYEAEKIRAIIKSTDYINYAVLLSGDVGFYSSSKKLLPLLNGIEVRQIPGISSMQYFCAKLLIPVDEVFHLTVHGKDSDIIKAIKTHKYTFLTMGKNVVQTIDKIARFFPRAIINIGNRLSYIDESIVSMQAEKIISAGVIRDNDLSVILIQHDFCHTCLEIGISDSEFIRGSVPMTKSGARMFVISKLKIAPTDICYDIGAGTGSVSVEMAGLCKKLYAVERSPEAAELIRTNAFKFCIDNIDIIEGSAPESLETLPPPDKVFIGGSTGRFRNILEFLLMKNKNLRFAATAGSIEGICDITSAVKALGLSDFECFQLNISESVKKGEYHLMSAKNPVFIITGELSDV
jgi:precorrin-6Y C5,15-methyltransferase (decarboxylating)